MVRGRSIDTSLPPTRALTVQREYRARKAAKMKSLEDAVSRLTAENTALRTEVSQLRARTQSQSLPNDQLAAVAAARADLTRALGHLDSVMAGAHAQPHSHSALDTLVSAASAAPHSDHVPSSVPTSTSSTSISPLRGASPPERRTRQTSTSFDSPRARPPRRACTKTTVTQSPAPAPEPPAPPLPGYDPQCCDGVFDCSSLAEVEEFNVAEDGSAERDTAL